MNKGVILIVNQEREQKWGEEEIENVRDGITMFLKTRPVKEQKVERFPVLKSDQSWTNDAINNLIIYFKITKINKIHHHHHQPLQ